MIYKGLVVVRASFGVEIWCDVLRFAYARELVNKCQRRVLYGCMVFCRTVSTDAMQVLMGELPWDLEFLRRGVMFRAKRGVSLGELGWLQIRLEEGENLEKKGVLDAKLWEIWQRRWDMSEKGRVTHDFVPSVRFASVQDGH